MFMAPIVAAKAPAPTALRRLTGAVVLPVSAVVMLPFLSVFAIYAAVVLTLRSLTKAPRALVDAVDFAGDVALGR